MFRLNQLPYLDSKHEYLWGSRVVDEVADRSVPVLRADKPHTVRSLTGRLLELARGGLDDTGFPVLVKDVDYSRDREFSISGNGKEREGRGREGSGAKGVLRVVGFLGINELEHALGEKPLHQTSINLRSSDHELIGIAELADDPDARVNLMPMDENHMRNSIHSTFSFADSGDMSRFNPYDISRYIDRVSLLLVLSMDPC